MPQNWAERMATMSKKPINNCPKTDGVPMKLS